MDAHYDEERDKAVMSAGAALHASLDATSGINPERAAYARRAAYAVFLDAVSAAWTKPAAPQPVMPTMPPSRDIREHVDPGKPERHRDASVVAAATDVARSARDTAYRAYRAACIELDAAQRASAMAATPEAKAWITAAEFAVAGANTAHAAASQAYVAAVASAEAAAAARS